MTKSRRKRLLSLITMPLNWERILSQLSREDVIVGRFYGLKRMASALMSQNERRCP